MDHAASPFTLEQRVKALPQELQDLIYDFTFQLPNPTTVVIDLNFKPPMNLQINKDIRSDFAKFYYRMFIFRSNDLYMLQNWVLSLPSEHRKPLYDLELHGYPDGTEDGDRSVARARATKFWQSLPSKVRKEVGHEVTMASYVVREGPFEEAEVYWSHAEEPMEIPWHWQRRLERERRKWKSYRSASWARHFWECVDGEVR